MYEIIDQLRKIEALFLPLLPKKWQNPPPSYRLIVPLLKKLEPYEKRYPWVGALLYSIQQNIYPAYHKEGLAAEKSQGEMRWLRFILTAMIITLLLSFTTKAHLLSPWVKGALFLGTCVLFIYGALHLSIGVLWATWGFLFPVISSLGIGVAPWALAFLTLWCLLLHAPLIKEKYSWHWLDGLSTLPILFFWVGTISKMIHTWSHWQSTLLFLILWLSVWGGLLRMGHHPWISKTLQYFWPASLTIVTLIILFRPGVVGISRLGLWFLGSLALSLGMSKLSFRIFSYPLLFRWQTMVIVFTAYGTSILLNGTPSQLKEAIDTGFIHLFNSLELLWWIVGAGIIMFVRRMALVLLKWIQILHRMWIILIAIWIIPILVYLVGWLSPLIEEMGELSAVIIWMTFGLGATIIAWRHKEVLLGEWMFWGFFAFFLFRRYWYDAHRTVELYWTKAASSTVGFLTLAIWLLWLIYYAVGKYLKGFREKIEGIGAIAFMGALLWLLVALLWVSYVDEQFSIRGRINYDLFRGFTFLGIPLIMNHMILRQYLKIESSQNLPWGWILITGVILTQILQGVEHSVVAWIEGQSFDALQKRLHHDLLNGTPIDKVVPLWVIEFRWSFSWRLLRWLFAMFTLTWFIRGQDKGDSLPSIFWMTACFTSLGVWTAESVWFFWPSMPLEWAVILRPWVQTTLIWDVASLKLCAFYLLAGFIWGWGLFQWKGHRDLKPSQ